MLTKSNALGFAVLTMLCRLRNEGLSGLLVEGYVNCREQGFSVAIPGGRQCVFSEDRGSVAIVVFKGRTLDFSFGGNVPQPTASREFFDMGRTEDAARAVLRFLEGE